MLREVFNALTVHVVHSERFDIIVINITHYL